jgi:CheY-like chemotaxis protein
MKKRTILWADDDQEDLDLFREALKTTTHSFTIVPLSNGRQVLDEVARLQAGGDLPCLIILDINMPVLGGRETLAALKKEEAYKNIPVVVFTTSHSELDRTFCRHYGVEMITKPPSFEELTRTVERMLRFCGEQ